MSRKAKELIILLLLILPPPPPPSILMMASEPEAKEQLMMAVVVILIILTAVELEMMLILHVSLFLFENLNILGQSAAELRKVTYDLAEIIGKRWIFGLDTTINR